jgi:hypothetical protein
LTVGNVALRLGMTKAAITSALGKQYNAMDRGKTADGSDFWVVTTADKVPQILGNLSFRQGRVVDVTRQWGEIEAQDTLTIFFQKLYGAFDSASSQTRVGMLTCKIGRRPNGTTSAVVMAFGNHLAMLAMDEYVLDGRPYNLITVDESVREQGQHGN